MIAAIGTLIVVVACFLWRQSSVRAIHAAAMRAGPEAARAIVAAHPNLRRQCSFAIRAAREAKAQVDAYNNALYGSDHSVTVAIPLALWIAASVVLFPVWVYTAYYFASATFAGDKMATLAFGLGVPLCVTLTHLSTIARKLSRPEELPSLARANDRLMSWCVKLLLGAALGFITAKCLPQTPSALGIACFGVLDVALGATLAAILSCLLIALLVPLASRREASALARADLLLKTMYILVEIL